MIKSPIVKRSVRINRRKTIIGLEHEFWNALKEIATDHNISIERLILKIDNEREQSNLSSAIRLFVLGYYCQQLAAADQRPSPRSDLP
jgi:predicted DNA-binding ribbon-helix-helix protein